MLTGIPTHVSLFDFFGDHQLPVLLRIFGFELGLVEHLLRSLELLVLGSQFSQELAVLPQGLVQAPLANNVSI